MIFFILAFISFKNVAAQHLQVVKNTQSTLVHNQSNQTVKKPKPLTLAEKIQVAQKIIGGQSKKVTSLETAIRLTVTNMWVKNRANLALVNPLSVSGWEGNSSATFGGQTGNLYVDFTAPSAGIYLVIVEISATSTAKFKLMTQGNILTTGGTSDEWQSNLSFIAEAKKANEKIHFTLEGKQIWHFYSCEISQIK
jgi:hypothetical protein